MAKTDHDWTKPAAMAIPEGGLFRAGAWAVRADISANAGLLRVLDHREGEGGARGGGAGVRQADPGRDCGQSRMCWRRCACTTCAGCSSMWDPDLHFQYQGIFDTDFDKYTEDAVALFSATGITTVFTNLEGFPEDWKENSGRVRQVRPRASLPQLPGVRRVSVCDGRRDQEGAAAEGGVLEHARPDAVTATEPSLLELDDIQHILLTRTPAVTGRYEFLSFDDPAGGRAWLTGLLDRVQSAADAHATMDASQRWITLAFTWSGLQALGVPRRVAGDIPHRVSRGHGGACRHPG